MQKPINELIIRFKDIATLEQHPPRIPSDLRTMGGSFLGGSSCKLLGPQRLLMNRLTLFKDISNG